MEKQQQADHSSSFFLSSAPFVPSLFLPLFPYLGKLKIPDTCWAKFFVSDNWIFFKWFIFKKKNVFWIFNNVSVRNVFCSRLRLCFTYHQYVSHQPIFAISSHWAFINVDLGFIICLWIFVSTPFVPSLCSCFPSQPLLPFFQLFPWLGILKIPDTCWAKIFVSNDCFFNLNLKKECINLACIKSIHNVHFTTPFPQKYNRTQIKLYSQLHFWNGTCFNPRFHFLQ